MKSTREQFEEIWPVPRGVFWDESEYMPCDLLDADEKYFELATEWDARLDTFARCQETTAIYSGIVDDMIREMELINSVGTDLRAVGIAREAIGRAKQKMGVMK
jgi:hypothetical protein